MRTMVLSALAAMLIACHPQVSLPAVTERVRFPREWAGAKVDFEVLRAIKAATDDYMPPPSIWVWLSETEIDRCVWSPRSLDYEVVETPEVVFVRLDVNPKHCGVHRAISDAGAQYAVRRSDGAILRFLTDGEPDLWPPTSEKSDLGKDAHERSSMPVEFSGDEQPEQRGPTISPRIGDQDCACTSQRCRR